MDFSALGRAVWDETHLRALPCFDHTHISVLSVEPYGMKHGQGAAVKIEGEVISVLSVEPYGMKPLTYSIASRNGPNFSALGRAVWDETKYYARYNVAYGDISVLSVEPYGMKRL